MKKKVGGIFRDRRVIGGILLLTQALLMGIFISSLSGSWYGFYWLFMCLSVVMVIWLVRKYDNPAYKITWIIVILVFPLFGGICYLFWGNTPFNRARRVNNVGSLQEAHETSLLTPYRGDFAELLDHHGRLAQYILRCAGTPVWKGTSSEFFPLGEDQYRSMLEEISKAERFVFLEYFIIEEGEMWNTILDLLARKVREGVDVRLMYDDAGCMGKLPRRYDKYLQSLGLQVVRFNPFIPTLNTYLNNRNHRKICVIDGNVGYMGGINLADEYINRIVRFGHWKDTGVLIRGQGVASMTAIFLQLWDFATKQGKETPALPYLPTCSEPDDGFVQPFGDSPMDNVNVGETVYMQIINNAKRYVYITTPYLVLDNEMLTALCTAAQSGVDVRILTPGVPDKKTVFEITRSFYQQLLRAGVKIYEYTPGFVHSKMVVADDDVTVVGTINMDFRSFFLHYECGTVFYQGQMPVKVRQDIEHALLKSEEITEDWMRGVPWHRSIAASILRIFAPLM